MSAAVSPSAGLSPVSPFPRDCAARFEPQLLLAAGGFGAVYRARQISLDRLVAVKILRGSELKDAEQRQRFIAEALITASIVHPNVVRVIDHGADCGIPWIAYEFLPGRSLRSSVEAGALAPRGAIEAASQIALALQAAHARGVLHRDIKPDNVMEVEPGQFKVTDFGIARWNQESAVRTDTGVVLGTPAYLSPEQARGEPATEASDIYACGVTLFELLTAQRPFESERPLEVLEMHLGKEPPAPGSLVAGVPPALDAIVLRAMQKLPSARLASAQELHAALAAVSAGEPVPGARPRPRSHGTGTVPIRVETVPRPI